jgi:hypothetical protein
MTLKWEQWLLAQCSREDSVGQLACFWSKESRANRVPDCELWLDALGSDPKWQSAISTAKVEFAISAECFKNGKSSPTFARLFASPKLEKVLKESSAYNRQHPEISAEVHLRQKHLGLLKALEARTLIYLDTCHWINLLHTLLENAKALPVYRDIFHLINNLAINNRVLCPVSFPLFLELMKQKDETTRLATARLMDCLSGGVCFQHPYLIQRLELRQIMLRGILRDKAPDLRDQVWTKVGFIAGEMLPFHKGFSEEDMCYLQKLSIDGMWETPLDHFAENVSPELSTIHQQKLAAATNTDAEWYRTEKISFDEALVREKAFSLRSLRKDFEEIGKEIFEDYPQYRDISKLPQPTAGEVSPWVLPSSQVLASINAALITSTKKFSANDILDFQHAALAVPYCDALFCDGPMAHILRTKPLEFGKVYETTILSDPNEIKNYLESLN